MRQARLPIQWILVLSMLAWHTSAIAQGGFRTRYHSPNAYDHWSLDIVETSPGTYMAGGISKIAVNNKIIFKLSLVGLDAAGGVTWTKEYGTLKRSYPNYPFCYKSFYKSDSHVYYAGIALDSVGRYFGTLFKFDFQGNIVWQQDYREPGCNLHIARVAPSVDGGFLISGAVELSNEKPALLIKTDSQGKELWRKRLIKEHPNRSDGRTVVQDPATKKIIIGGVQFFSVDSSRDVIFITDSLGNQLSRHTFCTGACSDLIQTLDGKIVAVGLTITSDLILSDRSTSYANKFDVNTPWKYDWSVKALGPPSLENGFFAAEQLPDSDILIGGTLDSSKGAIYSNMLSKFVWLDKDGKVRRIRYYSYNKDPQKDHVQVVVSARPASDGGWMSAVLARVLPGNALFFVKYDIDGCDSTTAYCKTVSVPEEGKKDTRVSIFPAITDGLIHVNMEACDQPSEIKIFTAYGEQLSHLHCDARSTADLDLSSLSAGMYIVLVESGGEKWVKRVVRR